MSYTLTDIDIDMVVLTKIFNFFIPTEKFIIKEGLEEIDYLGWVRKFKSLLNNHANVDKIRKCKCATFVFFKAYFNLKNELDDIPFKSYTTLRY